ncbi:MAG: substrate-binding domain-containing protein [Kiritimatiellia bacterium]
MTKGKAKKTVAVALGHGLEIANALIAKGIMKHAKAQGWELIDLPCWHFIIPKKTDGLIYENHIGDAKAIERLCKTIPHHVEMHPQRHLAAARGVATDMEALGHKAALYYLDRGFRNFALASYQTDVWTESLRTFKDWIEKHGGTCQAIEGLHLSDDVLLTTIRDAVRAQLRKLDYPLGIFCANDRLALRLCTWCIEEGIAVPEQAAILGFGNDLIACQTGPVPLSSISRDYEHEGIEAARLLQRMMDGQEVPAGTIARIPPLEIITRRSTDITALQDKSAAQALRYIWDHYQTPISPDDIAKFCDLPRRSLERRFKKALGRTLMKEVMRHRLSKAGELLVSTESPAVDIAARVGFMSPQYFNYQFKKKFGIPPQTYRERERSTDAASL